MEEGEGSVRAGGGTCYTCNLCNNASRVFAFAFSKIEAIGPYAYFRTSPTSSTPAPTSLPLLIPLPHFPWCSHCSLSVSTPFLLGVLFLSSPSSSGDTAQSLDICKSLCDAVDVGRGLTAGRGSHSNAHTHMYINIYTAVCVSMCVCVRLCVLFMAF